MSASYTRRLARAACALILLGAVTACGSDDAPSGPSADFDVVGAWEWQVTNATGQSASGQKATCAVTDVTFTRTNGVLSGRRFSSGGGNLVCAFNGKSATPANFTTDAPIQSLTLNGQAISFEFGNLTGGPWEMAGSVTGNDTMGGNATVRIATSAGVFTLTGPWTATRQ